jgi:hypothetical protein
MQLIILKSTHKVKRKKTLKIYTKKESKRFKKKWQILMIDKEDPT